MTDLNDMALFARVVEHGSFSATARALGMPKATLSRRIARLEDELEVRLLNRTTRSLHVTELGSEFLRHCQAVILAGEAGKEIIQRAGAQPKGRVYLTAPIAIAQSMLARLLPEFMLQYPEIEVHLEATNRAIDIIAEGIDVAVRVRHGIDDSSLILRNLAESSLLTVASPGLFTANSSVLHPHDLVRFPSLSMRFADGRPRWEFSRTGEDPINVSHKPRLVTDDMTVLREAAVQGVGVVALPGFVCRPWIESGDLIRVCPDWQHRAGQIHAVYPHRKGLLPVVRCLVDFLAERFPVVAKQEGVRPDS